MPNQPSTVNGARAVRLEPAAKRPERPAILAVHDDRVDRDVTRHRRLEHEIDAAIAIADMPALARFALALARELDRRQHADLDIDPRAVLVEAFGITALVARQVEAARVAAHLGRARHPVPAHHVRVVALVIVEQRE